MPVVLFLCIENACRSLMAEAMFNAEPPEGWRATSAGTRPARAPNPRTGPMLEEVGLRIPDHPPRELTTQMLDGAGVRITMGCLDDASCPSYLRALEVRDWGMADPARLNDEGFRRVRDELRTRVRGLIADLELPVHRGRRPGVDDRSL